MNMPAGYQCIAELSLHKAAISSIAISSDSGRLAVGDESGMVCETVSLLQTIITPFLLHWRSY